MKTIFNKPAVIGVCADVNQGKSMLLYHMLEQLSKQGEFDLYTYGLRLNVENSQQIFSVREMETVKNSIIVIDELSSLFDLDNRKVKKAVENTLKSLLKNFSLGQRLFHHFLIHNSSSFHFYKNTLL